MKPFRNVGWTYYNRLQIILPNATARGSYMFSASTSTQPISANLNEVVDETGDGLGNVTRSDPFNANEVPLAASTPASTQSNKWRVSALLHDDDVASNDISHSTSVSSRKRSQPSGSTFISHSVSEKSQKLTLTLVLHGMQGSINRLTYVWCAILIKLQKPGCDVDFGESKKWNIFIEVWHWEVESGWVIYIVKGLMLTMSTGLGVMAQVRNEQLSNLGRKRHFSHPALT